MIKGLGIGCLIVIGFTLLLLVIGAVATSGRSTGAEGRTSAPRATQASESHESLVKPLNVEIKNRYAESLFTLDVTVGGNKVDGGTAPIGKRVRVFERARCSGWIEKEKVFLMAKDAELRINLAATSLGEERYFTAKLEPDPKRDTLRIEYDWDVATARFTINYGWH